MSAERERLLADYLAATWAEANDPDPSPMTEGARDVADDLLQNWKRDHDECLIPECAAVTPHHSYCPEHR